MKESKLILYRIMPSLGKDGSACVRWALSEWERDLKGRVKFEAAGPERLPDWQFEMSEVDSFPEAIAMHNKTSSTTSLIRFDPRVKWAKTKMQRFFLGSKEDLQRLALHEIGHALGIRDHSNDTNSIMHSNPSVDKIDKKSLGSVKI